MALVHYGFSREEAMWMPVTEFQDYILLINQQIEEENGEMTSAEHQDDTPKTFQDVFRGVHLT